MKKNIHALNGAQKFSLIRREAIYTELALIGLIIFSDCGLRHGVARRENFSPAALDCTWNRRRVARCNFYRRVVESKIFHRHGTWIVTTMRSNFSALLPLILFMAVMVAINVFVRHRQAGKNFVSSYFVDNRKIGGFVPAMTTDATYSSVSSFFGGSGMAFQVGFNRFYMAVVQVTAIFPVLGIFGKHVALLTRKLNAVTVVDIICARFQSDFPAAIAAFVIVLFFCGTMTTQFVGGAKIFAA